MMKKNAYRLSLAVIALLAFGSMAALAQTKTQPRYADLLKHLDEMSKRHRQE